MSRSRVPSIRFLVLVAAALVLGVVSTPGFGAPRVLMLIAQRSMDAEFFILQEVTPMLDLLAKAGCQVEVATVDGKAVVRGKANLRSDLAMSNVDLLQYAAVVVPCMGASDYPPTRQIIALLREANGRGMLIAAQNASEVLVPAGLADDHEISEKAGVVTDKNLITSFNCPFMAREGGKPVDTPELIRRLVEALPRET